MDIFIENNFINEYLYLKKIGEIEGDCQYFSEDISNYLINEYKYISESFIFSTKEVKNFINEKNGRRIKKG